MGGLAADVVPGFKGTRRAGGAVDGVRDGDAGEDDEENGVSAMVSDVVDDDVGPTSTGLLCLGQSQQDLGPARQNCERSFAAGREAESVPML